MDDRTLAAFLERIEVNELTGCWVWRGYINPKTRYGTWTSWENGKAKTYSVHRTVYELFKGPIAPKMVLDHLCWHRACCNPLHLDPITQSENIKRGASAKFQDGAAFQRNKTHCPQGHPYDAENTGPRKKGGRYCRTCARAASAAYKAKMDAQNPKPPREPQQFCKRGHEFTPENTYVIPSTGSRSCKTCKRADVERYRESKS